MLLAGQSLLGLITLTGFAWLISENRKQVEFRNIVSGLLIQLFTAILLIKIPFFKNFFMGLNRLVESLQESTAAGTSFVFGYLGGGSLPFSESFPGASFILGIQALPLVLVISALSSLLFYWRIMPIIVKSFSWILQKSLNIGGALGVGASANIFVGMVEAPLFIRPYLGKMSRSELFCIMTCGMATIAGTVMVLYAGILQPVIPDAMGHILTASIISAPAAITIAGIMVPETEEITRGDIISPQNATSSMDAIVKGTADGLNFLLQITAMLIVLIALVHLANLILGLLPQFGGEALTLQRLLGYIMAPVCWLIGVPWQEAHTAGSLMGTKTVMNELLAYLDMSRLPKGALSPRSTLIMTYAMCGFANFGSLGIMIGGLGTAAPERKDEIVAMGFKSIVAGTMATCMTGAIIGILLSW